MGLQWAILSVGGVFTYDFIVKPKLKSLFFIQIALLSFKVYPDQV